MNRSHGQEVLNQKRVVIALSIASALVGILSLVGMAILEGVDQEIALYNALAIAFLLSSILLILLIVFYQRHFLTA